MRRHNEQTRKAPAGSHRLHSTLLVLLSTGLAAWAVGYGASTGASAAASEIRGNAQHGQQLIEQFGCGTCHLIPGVNNADALAAPPLMSWQKRIYIAGLLRNTPENLQRWIQHPQQIVPNNAMPDMGIDDEQAQDIVAYLYTLK